MDPHLPASPNAPWTMVFTDGCNNNYQVEAVAIDRGAFTYSPVTAIESSSGTYNGGHPHQGTCGHRWLEQCWQQARTLAHTPGLRRKTRTKGTSVLTLKLAGVSRSTLLGRSPEVLAFERWLRQLLD